jgi:hypothetical protein
MEENLGRASAIETGTKLYISNLDYGVSNEDVKVILFPSFFFFFFFFFFFCVINSVVGRVLTVCLVSCFKVWLLLLVILVFCFGYMCYYNNLVHVGINVF